MASRGATGEEDADGENYLDGEQVSTLSAQEQLRVRLSRKRTKTGCLTCRKRRIKCGEERPVCRNCIKSKRHCEGYNQRVIFKQPFYDFQPGPNGAAHITFQAGLAPGPATPFYGGAAPSFVMAQLQPRPVEQFVPHVDQPQLQDPPERHSHEHHQFVYSASPATGPPEHQPVGMTPGRQSSHSQPYLQATPVQPIGQPQQMPTPRPDQSFGQDGHNHAFEFGREGHDSTFTRPMTRLGQSNQTTGVHQLPQLSQWPARHQTHVLNPSNPPYTLPARAATNPNDNDNLTQMSQASQYSHHPVRVASINGAQAHPSWPPVYFPDHSTTPEYDEHEIHVPLSDSPTQLLSRAAVEIHDVDYYDVETDEEMEIDTQAIVAVGQSKFGRLSQILDFDRLAIHDAQTRRYDTFLFDGIVAKYRVEEHANPLNNPATARVFAHFISVTGPSLSIFERHPRNTSVLFTSGQVPLSQQGLWTYTMPLAALRNQGLLHAMLALASLHIARLTGASVTPSIQHYAWALKRIHGSVSDHKKRLHLTTVAASMLLGFYEIMTADHMKWNTHLAGSRQLFVETDFVSMMQQFRQMKMDAASRQRAGSTQQSTSPVLTTDEVLEQIPSIDEKVLGRFTGREVRYGDHGQVMTPASIVPQELDLSKLEILKDLFWWYCKQDAWQSIISGNPLLMDYSRWADCPPRAQLGRPDAVYGSFDHLVLLTGRIADFSARDRARKLRQMELNGGQWRPPPGMPTPRPPQQAPPPPTMPTNAGTMSNGRVGSYIPPQALPPPTQPQMFYGMAPPPSSNVQMPTAYWSTKRLPTPQTSSRHEPLMDINLATQAALHDYNSIRAALDEFESSLGEAFQPLSSEYQVPFETPFGPSACYRSYDIACLWALYHMIVIIAIRSHPYMPPAAHMAAGVAARDTKHHAEEIGRIVAGIAPGPIEQPLNPSLGAALCESCMPSFFAAVQYQDPHQRYATVSRIFSIAQRTGWGTAELIASGCETAWCRAAEAGRGPPYQRLVRKQNSDDPRLNGSWERLDPNARPDEEDDTDRRHVRSKAQARLNWAIGVMGLQDDELRAATSAG
ncbi:hypothetical protein LTR62_004791 [Meristemomyces frigidus]|uniref:Zn(2)-C6 fungal-type domain-containing protein n=1 Tax=Meristemomyces frigidus TaxID=1508187 RepID=A0AAN7YFT7_9PEZI|nr:hypothetical protein LTR62_004791 [Meristemomyces frigidus]